MRKINPGVDRALSGSPLNKWYSELLDEFIQPGKVIHKEFNGYFGCGKSQAALTDAYVVHLKLKQKYGTTKPFNPNERIAQTVGDMKHLIERRKVKLKKTPNVPIGPFIRDEVTFEGGTGSRTNLNDLRNLIIIHREDRLWVTMVEKEPSYQGVREILMTFDVIGNSWAQKMEDIQDLTNFSDRAKEIAESDEGTLCLINVRIGGRLCLVEDGYLIVRSINNPRAIEQYLKLKRKFNIEYGKRQEEPKEIVLAYLLGSKEITVMFPLKDRGGDLDINKTRLESRIKRLLKMKEELPSLSEIDIADVAKSYEYERILAQKREDGDLSEGDS